VRCSGEQAQSGTGQLLDWDGDEDTTSLKRRVGGQEVKERRQKLSAALRKAEYNP
jgi:hypothetical protein